jgi:hypothetical protein
LAILIGADLAKDGETSYATSGEREKKSAR